MSDASVRAARPEDTAAALRVLRASISELCVDDHRHDAFTLQRWLANKTPEHFLRWLAEPDAYLVVAEVAAQVRGVGYLSRAGKIHLCYIEPGFERRGVGRALLASLEARALAWGLSSLELESSLGARAFYERLGYVSAGSPTCAFGVLRCYPYKKTLTSNS